jgi:hypothetical protein
MRRIITVFLLLAMVPAFAQKKDILFGNGEKKKPRKGFVLNGNLSFDLPAGDMAKRFGASYRIGPALLYKTEKNWVFGAKFDFITGNKITEDSLMINIKDKYASNRVFEFINNDGERIGVPIYERGYAVGVHVGKIFPLDPYSPDNGILIMTTVGFMQHRINIYDKDKSVQQIRGQYLKGYDRLTNGAFVEQYAGYTYFAKNGLLNFTLGIDALFGFTQGRRDYLYDVMRPDNQRRFDMLWGLRGGWFVPMFRRKSEDLLFEGH